MALQAGGFVRYDSGLSVGGAGQHLWGDGVNGGKYLATGSASWAIGARFRIPSGVIDANSQAWIGAASNVITGYLRFGLLGTSSTTKFVIDWNGGGASAAVSAVDLDNNWHTAHVVRVGTTTTVYLDGASILSGNYHPSQDAGLYAGTATYTLNNRRHFDLSWICAMYVSP